MTFTSERLWPQSLLLMVVLSSAATSLLADSVNTTKRQVMKLADGIYEIRHPDAPDTFPQGNTTVIIGDRAVFVVDSCYLPSSAREDIAQIRQWTDKPVRYLLITHFHVDHNLGNSAYAEAFPALTILAQAETKGLMAGSNPPYVAKYPQQAERYEKQLETGKDPSGRPLTDIERRDMRTAIIGAGKVWEEFENLTVVLPTLTFDRGLDVDLGNREVQVKFLGRGNTAGDAVAYLPREKILITGDLLDYPVPYLGGGYPVEEIATLEEMARLDAETIVPGHGEVLRDKGYIYLVIEFMKAIVAEVRRDVFLLGADAKKYPEVRKLVDRNMDLKSWRRKFAGDDADNNDFFDTFTLPGVVEAAHAEIWPR